MADPLGTFQDFFKFPGEPRGKGFEGKPQSSQFSRFFEEIDRLQGLGVDELTNRNLRASIPQIDRGFNQGASRLSESLGGRGLQFGGIARGANQGLANLLGVSRGQASLDALLQAEDQRRSGIQNALSLFGQLFGIRTGQAQVQFGSEASREQSKARQQGDRRTLLEVGAKAATAVAGLF